MCSRIADFVATVLTCTSGIVAGDVLWNGRADRASLLCFLVIATLAVTLWRIVAAVRDSYLLDSIRKGAS